MFDFPDTIETSKIPATWAFCYVPGEDGSSTFNGDFQEVRSTIGGLRTSLDRARNDASKAKGKDNETVTAVNNLLTELNVDSVEALSAHISSLNETIEAGSKVNPEKIRAEIEGGYQKQIADKDTEIQGLKGVMKDTILGRDVMEAIAHHEGNAQLLAPFVQGKLAMIEEEGKMVVRVKDSDGDYVGNGKGGWQSVNELVGTLKQDPQFAGAFKAPGGPGGPGMQNQHQQQQNNNQNRDSGDRSPIDKIKSGLAARQGYGNAPNRGAQTPPGMS